MERNLFKYIYSFTCCKATLQTSSFIYPFSFCQSDCNYLKLLNVSSEASLIYLDPVYEVRWTTNYVENEGRSTITSTGRFRNQQLTHCLTNDFIIFQLKCPTVDEEQKHVSSIFFLTSMELKYMWQSIFICAK